MKRITKFVGTCLIVALAFCAMSAIPAYADDGNTQGQTTVGPPPSAPSPDEPPSDPAALAALLLMLLLVGFN
jgi:hypothetical protein